MILGIGYAHWLVILSVFISIGGSIAYIRDTLAGRTKPNRVSWFLWALAPILGTIAALSAHADVWVTVRIFVAGFIPLTVFIFSFVNPNSYWKLTRFDYFCGAFAVAGLILWASTGSPQIAVLFLAAADGFAALPTIIKAWKNPETETGFTYLAGLVGTILVLPSIPVWNIQNSAFQIYLLIVNSLLLLAIYRKRLIQ